MNVGVFNKVNYKERNLSGGSSQMYGEWSCIALGGGAGHGVLGALRGGGREVTLAVLKQLVPPPQQQRVEHPPLNTHQEVEWVMEVIRYGLSLPLTEQDALRDCVTVYCDWLSALLPSNAVSGSISNTTPPIPTPVLNEPERYARRIIEHLHNLFVPRPGEVLPFIYQEELGTDTINKQAVLCHRVLRSVQQVCARANLSQETWYSALSFLLAINDTLLAPPAVKDDVADQLCERVLSVLFEVWIIACHRCFPSPPLWKTLREATMRWRHRTALTEQWTRVTLCLTAKLLYNMYGPMFPILNINEEDVNLIPGDMSYDNISQSWYRMLHTIGNPVDLCRPQIISQTPQFLQFAITQEDACDPSQHPCLLALPTIFLKAMKGLAAQVDAFLGLPRSSLIGLTSSRPVSVAPTTPPNPIPIASSTERPPLAPVRPRVNSILHLFGDWLFEAALIGTFTHSASTQRVEGTPPPSLPDLPSGLQIQNYQAGRAEALGALCRVFTSKQSRETVLAAYYARFYIAVQRGLQDPATVPSVLLNAADIFRLDLDGVYILVPDFIEALEKVLPEKELKLNSGNVDKKELRRASISILLSLLVVPHHLQNLPIKELPGNPDRGLTFGDLSARVSLLVVGAVQAEWCPPLAVPLLSALYLCISHAPTNAGQGLLGAPQTASGRSEGDSTGHGAHSSSSSLHGTPSSIDDLPNADSLLRDIEPSTPGFGSGLLVRATYLVCHRLISSWKSDLIVSLAALELLAGLARLHNTRSDSLECKRAVRWICDYISVQCSRPPPAHSRDLHSSVVAAYHCLAAWLRAPLLADPECLATVMEVVELGISGSKSIGKPGESLKMKDEKELKPVSMRVRDAAENLLALILEQVGGFPSACGSASLGSLLDERTLARHCTPSIKSATHRFRYFVADDSTLLALLEEPLANDQDPQPTLTVILRGAFGRHAWTLQLRQLARSRAGGRVGASKGTRPVTFWEPPPTAPPTCSPLPQGPPSAADKSFPSLDSVLRSLNDPGANQLFKLLETQAAIEKTARDNPDAQTNPEECVPPEPVQDFQTARLFLTHFGFLNIGSDRKAGVQRLLALDSSSEEFRRELGCLDKLGARAAATAHIFYCARSQRHPQDVLRNTRQRESVSPAFLEMLRGLGRPVKVKDHAGWTGHIDTSYNPVVSSEVESDSQENYENSKASSAFSIDPENHGGALYNGDTHILYWADASSEIAFIVPTDKDETEVENLLESHSKTDADGNCVSNCSMGSGNSCSSWDVSNNPANQIWYDRSISESTSNIAATSIKASVADKPRTLSLDFEKHSPNSSFSSAGSGRRNRQHSTKILIIWLESYEDHLDLSIDNLLRYTETGVAWRRSEVCVLWVQLLGCGLVRVRAQSSTGTGSGGNCPAGPLADGAVLELRRLPSALRHTALNIARRARLHDDSYQLPHVRRRHKIQEIAQKFKRDLSEPELLTSLFADPV
ncbi:ral GTPase-activating protein subunit beta isoform X2 [Arctopsyche grandis]|uniref:ral GTPase-activating protein subunit beta isoform X2 n=1 Tax=Arctopsyche grandis TaxID=121162 RepID=UPI00406D8644